MRAAACSGISHYQCCSALYSSPPRETAQETLCERVCFDSQRRIEAALGLGRAGAAPKRLQTTGRKFIHAKPNGGSVSLETRSIRPFRGSWHAFGRPVLRSVARGTAVRERYQMSVRVFGLRCREAREADAMGPENKKTTARPRLVLDRRRHPIGFFRIAAFRGSYIAACRRRRRGRFQTSPSARLDRAYDERIS